MVIHHGNITRNMLQDSGIRAIVVNRLAATVAAHEVLRRQVKVAGLARFYLFERHRHRRLRVETVNGFPFLVLPDVFNPRLFRTGDMLAQYIASVSLPAGARVLDLGCGSGVVAVFAARTGVCVSAVDINPEAVRCTRFNTAWHGVADRVDICEGDLFEPVSGKRFDLVVFNPPYFAGRPRELWEHAWRSEGIIDRFATALPEALAPGGRAILILSTVARGAVETLMAAGLRVRVLVERQLITERLSIVEVTP